MSKLYIQPTLGRSEQAKDFSDKDIPRHEQPHSNMEEETQTRAPLAVVLADKIINGTRGTLSIDLVRHNLPETRSRTSLFTYKETQQQQSTTAPGPWSWLAGTQRPQRRRRISQVEMERQRQHYDYDNLPNNAFNASGARFKVLRHVSFGPPREFTTYSGTVSAPMCDFGAGFEFKFATAELHPIVRLKINNVLSLRLLPDPAVKFQKRMQLGTSGVGVKMSYECPIGTDTRRFYAPPARLMITLDNSVENGVRLTQNGVEFAANAALLGEKARLRAAGVLRLPSEIPFDEDELFLGFTAKRVGMKMQW